MTAFILILVGAASAANGAWMLIAPAHWYARIPACVPDFGPFSAHFLRDIGCAYLCSGIALLAAARAARELRLALLAAPALFFVSHALLHVYDTAAGNVPPRHWLADAPLVYLPALLLLAAAYRTARGLDRRRPC